MSTVLLQIAIPVYNEADNIMDVLEEIEAKVTTPHRINIIYDFDEDNTLPAIAKYVQVHKVENIHLECYKNWI
jgi:dolichol-phosphate mannosyltransferase